MKLIRWLLGNLIVALDRLFQPTPMSRSATEQARIDQETRSLAIYQFETCPFCVKVRRGLRRLSLNIELRDARNNPQFRDELVRGGGQLQVPCLRIEEAGGKVSWMYESSDILEYLEKRFSHADFAAKC